MGRWVVQTTKTPIPPSPHTLLVAPPNFLFFYLDSKILKFVNKILLTNLRILKCVLFIYILKQSSAGGYLCFKKKEKEKKKCFINNRVIIIAVQLNTVRKYSSKCRRVTSDISNRINFKSIL